MLIYTIRQPIRLQMDRFAIVDLYRDILEKTDVVKNPVLGIKRRFTVFPLLSVAKTKCLAILEALYVLD